MSVYHLVDKLTGYDIRELEHKDEKFYTPDGEDLWKVLEQKYSETYAGGVPGSFGLGDYYSDYKYPAQKGWTEGDEQMQKTDI